MGELINMDVFKKLMHLICILLKKILVLLITSALSLFKVLFCNALHNTLQFKEAELILEMHPDRRTIELSCSNTYEL